MRWVAAPLIAGTVFVGSGFLSALEDSTEASLRLAALSEDAPRSTAEAVAELDPLPVVARLTARQADLAHVLADALEISSNRLDDVNASLERQGEGLRQLEAALAGLAPRIACIRSRTADLLRSARESPQLLGDVTVTLRRVVPWQEKSVRHLRSINRKLAALGLVAAATDAEPPPPPPPTTAPEAEPQVTPIDC